MKNNIIKRLSQSQIKIFILLFILIIFLRSCEFFLVFKYHGLLRDIIKPEIAGIINDLIQFYAVLLVFFLLNNLLFNPKKWLIYIFYGLAFLFGILHILIIKYFSYQLEFLDIFLFKYTYTEVNYTLITSGIDYAELVIILLLFITIFIVSLKALKKWKLNKYIKNYALYIIIFISLMNFIPFLSQPLKINKFSINKSVYFYSQLCKNILSFDKSEKLYQSSGDFHNLFNTEDFISSDYPLIHKNKYIDILGPNFYKSDTTPNIVIIIVEGLNNDFINEYKGVMMMPFLNNLANKSLYWDHFFTLGERSFAVVPSILGSLPYGEKGFTLLDKFPYHHTLISLLKKHHYYTSFFYGQGSWFHNKNIFFKYNYIDLIFDNAKFSDSYKKIMVDDFFWGYNDKDLFDQSFEVIDTLPTKKRLDIYFTGTSHSPFKIDNEDFYNSRLEKLNKQSFDSSHFFNTYSKYVKSILFVDDALKSFFSRYKDRDDFKNTIFIITGDHPMTEIPIKNKLKRYHVPLIIYSPLLKKAKKFHGISSHLDIYNSILNFLEKNYNLTIPENTASFGEYLDTTNNWNKKIAFMNDNREIVNFYSNGYFIANEDLYKVDSNFDLHKLNNDSLKVNLKRQLEIIKKTSLFVSTHNKIMPDTMYIENLGFSLIKSKAQKAQIKINTEFYDLLSKTKIPNQECILEVSFDFEGKIDKNTTVVYQVKDKNNNVLFWRNSGINNDHSSFQNRITIPQQENITGENVYVECLIWNQSRQNILISDMNIILYTQYSVD